MRVRYKHAEHVFRTVARAAHRMREDFGRHKPPETVRVAEEDDANEDSFGSGGGFDAGTFIEKSFAKTKALTKRREEGAPGAAPSVVAELGLQVKASLERASRAADELLLCGKRSVDHVRGQLGGGKENAVVGGGIVVKTMEGAASTSG